MQDELQPVSAIETQRQEAGDLGNPGNLSDPRSINENATPDAVTPAVTEVSSIRYTARAFRAMSDESRAQELLNRDESRYDRQYERAMNSPLRPYRANKKKGRMRSPPQRKRKTQKVRGPCARNNPARYSRQPKGRNHRSRENATNENANEVNLT